MPDAPAFPLEVAAGVELAADDAFADDAGELVDVAALDVAALDEGALDAAALADAPAEPLAAGEPDARNDAEGLAADVPSAAGEPLVPGVAPEGPHATERRRAARADEAMTLVLMRRLGAYDMPRARGTRGATLRSMLRARELARRIGRRRSRSIGIACIAYGASGLVLLSALALSIIPMLKTIDTVATSSADLRSTLATTHTAFDGFAMSVVDARRSAERASAAARSSAATAKQLADGMSVSIFGAQPLASLASGFQRQSSDLTALAEEIDALATSLGQNETDVRAIGTSLGALERRAGAIGVDGASWVAPALVLLLLWLAIPAVAAIWLGIVLVRGAATRRAA